MGTYGHSADALHFPSHPGSQCAEANSGFTYSKGQHIKSLRYLRMQDSENISRCSRPFTISDSSLSLLKFLASFHAEIKLGSYLASLPALLWKLSRNPWH